MFWLYIFLMFFILMSVFIALIAEVSQTRPSLQPAPRTVLHHERYGLQR